MTYIILRKQAIRKAGWDLQENKKFGSRYYTELSVERMDPFSNKKKINPSRVSLPVSYYSIVGVLFLI